MSTAAKAWVALIIATVGSGVTAGLAFATQGDPWFVPLTIGGAMLTTAGTAFGVYRTPNRPK